jgi:hypothetical protein
MQSVLGVRPSRTQSKWRRSERASAAPLEVCKDCVERWRAAEVQRLIAREYGMHYHSIAVVACRSHAMRR